MQKKFLFKLSTSILLATSILTPVFLQSSNPITAENKIKTIATQADTGVDGSIFKTLTDTQKSVFARVLNFKELDGFPNLTTLGYPELDELLDLKLIVDDFYSLTPSVLTPLFFSRIDGSSTERNMWFEPNPGWTVTENHKQFKDWWSKTRIRKIFTLFQDPLNPNPEIQDIIDNSFFKPIKDGYAYSQVVFKGSQHSAHQFSGLSYDPLNVLGGYIDFTMGFAPSQSYQDNGELNPNLPVNNQFQSIKFTFYNSAPTTSLPIPPNMRPSPLLPWTSTPDSSFKEIFTANFAENNHLKPINVSLKTPFEAPEFDKDQNLILESENNFKIKNLLTLKDFWNYYKNFNKDFDIKDLVPYFSYSSTSIPAIFPNSIANIADSTFKKEVYIALLKTNLIFIDLFLKQMGLSLEDDKTPILNKIYWWDKLLELYEVDLTDDSFFEKMVDELVDNTLPNNLVPTFWRVVRNKFSLWSSPSGGPPFARGSIDIKVYFKFFSTNGFDIAISNEWHRGNFNNYYEASNFITFVSPTIGNTNNEVDWKDNNVIGGLTKDKISLLNPEEIKNIILKKSNKIFETNFTTEILLATPFDLNPNNITNPQPINNNFANLTTDLLTLPKPETWKIDDNRGIITFPFIELIHRDNFNIPSSKTTSIFYNFKLTFKNYKQTFNAPIFQRTTNYKDRPKEFVEKEYANIKKFSEALNLDTLTKAETKVLKDEIFTNYFVDKESNRPLDDGQITVIQKILEAAQEVSKNTVSTSLSKLEGSQFIWTFNFDNYFFDDAAPVAFQMVFSINESFFPINNQKPLPPPIIGSGNISSGSTPTNDLTDVGASLIWIIPTATLSISIIGLALWWFIQKRKQI